MKTFKHGIMDVQEIILVYQTGIANVFAVGTEGERKRLIQADFRACENFARGIAITGIKVRSAGCNQAGDIIASRWDYEDLGPFKESTHPVNEN